MYITHNNKGLQGTQMAWWLFLHITARSYPLFNIDQASFNSNVHLIFNIWPFL